MLDRRHFLAGALPAAWYAAKLRAAAPAPVSAAVPKTNELADRLWLLSGYGGNVTLFHSPEGVLLVDGGAAAHSAALLAEVRRLTGQSRVHTLFNTHWHADQTGANRPLGEAGTRIIAHENTRLWLTTTVDSKWEGRSYPPLPKPAQPNQTFYENGSLQFGGETIDYGYLPQAHTDGDLYVFLRKANVLVAADVLAVGSFPIIDYCTNGWIGGMATAAQTLVELADAGTQVIPGSGAPQRRAALEAEQKMLATLRQRLAGLLAQGRSAEEMIAAAPAREYEAERGDPTLFIRNCYPGLAHRARELGVSIV